MGTHKDEAPSDIWADWILHGRYGGDAGLAEFVRRDVKRFRERVLDGARLAAGMTLLDVGSGDGLIGLGAIERIGSSLRVILVDISAPLLEHARALAREGGVEGQCRFLCASSERLVGVEDGTVDVVATRASLAYAADKQSAFQEFHRVLKPGGRISLAEPITQDDAFEVCALGKLMEAQPAHPNIGHLRLLHRWKAAQYPGSEEEIWRNPMTNFNERDLVRLARQAGFVDVHLELHIDHRLTPSADGGPLASWEAFLAMSPYPGARSLGEIMEGSFSAEEKRAFEAELRPEVELRTWATSEIMAYLTAEKRRA